ncbi:hypothetical protein CRE_15393 [Caenorhabditis remanei]|uniref:Matrix-remodeling-associated protein 7 helical domain-containing protein n=1 Tax=Caenorhabditis remanei TaxID=31234 RepID=E3MC47_CAERE|nr:hypothetical protein CRE_15393 [Caenorhabditis remanei]
MKIGYTTEEWAVIWLTILGGALFGFFLNFLWSRKRRNDQKKEEDKFVGKMNTVSYLEENHDKVVLLQTGLRKNRVIFSPEICENGNITLTRIKNFKILFPEVPEVINLDSDSDEEKTESESNSDEQEDEDEEEVEGEEDEIDEEDEGEEDEEEQMPQFNKRKLKNTQNADDDEPSTSDSKKDLSESDKINATLGKLHGKLATAQLKAKTRQIAAEMSEQEKEYEAKMTNNQMESIMKLMMQNQEKFGMSSEDIKEQMNLYNF